MRKLSPALFAGLVACAISYLSIAPATAQERCGSKTAPALCLGDKNTPVRVKGTLFLDGPTQGNDGGFGITMSGRATLVQDFPALPTAGLLTAGNHMCDESDWGQTATGVRFGDTCTLGMDQAYVNAFGFCQGYVSAADEVKVRCCGFLNDAGSFNMPDASYTVRCFR